MQGWIYRNLEKKHALIQVAFKMRLRRAGRWVDGKARATSIPAEVCKEQATPPAICQTSELVSS